MQRSAKLLDDSSFIDAQNRQLTYEYNYHVNPIWAPGKLGGENFDTCATFLGGCGRQTFESGKTIDASNRLRNSNYTRPAVRPQTEVFGTSAYRGLGDGVLHHVADSNDLQRTGFTGNRFCAAGLGKYAEVNYDRFDCIEAPTAVENFQHAGVSSRQAPMYLRGQGGCMA